jgi:hypothetical protein
MRHFLLLLFLEMTCNLLYSQIDSVKLFESTKGKWPLPVQKYSSIYNNELLKNSHYGRFDSTLRITTDSSYQIFALHEGKVSRLLKLDERFLIVTKFGKYLIAYNNVTKPNISQGDFIKAGHRLGELSKDSVDENYTLEIYLFKGKIELSARKWIAW